MTIAVLGSQGQLGRDLVHRARAMGHTVQELTRTDMDLVQPDTVRNYFETHKPEIFVNCAAYNFVDKAETEQEEAFAANAWGVRCLAQEAAKAGSRLVHFSTDYVFGLDRDRKEPFAETDAPGPVSVYGASKLIGEYMVREASPKHLVIRTCGLYGLWGSGGKGGNFVETMLRVASQGKPLKVVSDQRCTPTFTVDLAEATLGLIDRRADGLFHVVNAGDCSWYEFAKEIFRISNVSADLSPTTSMAFSAPARRPGFSVLSCEKLTRQGVATRHWREALAVYLEGRKAKQLV